MSKLFNRFIFVILSISGFNFSQGRCGTLLGRSGLLYTTTHNIFRSGQTATGVVRISNGFSVVTPASGVGSTHGSSVIMDTCLSVSGVIDLRDTNTIILLNDLKFESGVTFSASGGCFYGYDHALVLDGNLNLASNTILHFGGRTIIEGQGHTLNLGDNSQLFVDTDATLTLRNLIISNRKNFAGNPAIKLASSGSQLALDNSILDLIGDFYFSRGSMFIHNDVAFTGTSAFVYSSCQPSFITSGASLIFDIGTTFSFVPATFTVCPYTVSRTYTTNDFIKMADETSNIIFNGCNFYTTFTGLRLTTGSAVFDNKVNLKSDATNNISSTPVTSIGSVSTGTNPYSVKWSPDGRFLAEVNIGSDTLEIFRFTASGSPSSVGSVSTGTNPYSVDWSPDGKFLAVANNGGNTLQIFRFAGSGSPTSVGVASTGTGPYSINWSPDGKFLAVANNGGSTLQIFRFAGAGKPISVGSVGTDTAPREARWSPDGNFLAVGTYTSGTLQIFSFSGGGNPTLVGSVSTSMNISSVDWSPDGRFVAVVMYDATLVFLAVYRFSGTGNPYMIGVDIPGDDPFAVRWSPDGSFLAIVANTDATLSIFRFAGDDNITKIGSVSTGVSPYAVEWSPNGSFVAVVNESDSTLQTFGVNFIPTTDTQALSTSIVFGNSALGSNYDLDVNLLAGARLNVDGFVNYDCVN